MNNCEGASYTVQPGDTLNKIANRYDITVEDLILANPQIEDPNQIFVGQTICIPIVDKEAEKWTVLLLPALKFPPYKVKEADPNRGGVILYQQLAEETYNAIVLATRLPPPQSISSIADEYLVIAGGGDGSLKKVVTNTEQPTWVGALTATDPSYFYGFIIPNDRRASNSTGSILIEKEQSYYSERYVVRAGDNLYKIAQKYNLTVDSLIAANPQIEEPSQIFVGDLISLPLEAEVPKKCAVVLTTPEYIEPDSDRTGGVVLVQELEEGGYTVTFGATGLPAPATIGDGDFDAYLGGIRIDGERYFASLEEVILANQSVWAGTIIISENPFATSETGVAIIPRTTEGLTNPRLIGRLADCAD